MRPRGDRGSISLFTVLFTPAVVLLAGLLVDGGLAIHARQRAADMAEQAARAGANNIDENRLRETGRVEVVDDGPNGTTCAKAYRLLEQYATDVTSRSCATSADEVDVTIEITVEPQLLGIVPGLGDFRMRSQASAHPETGNP